MSGAEGQGCEAHTLQNTGRPEAVESGFWCYARNCRGLLGVMLQKIESLQKSVGGREAAGRADNRWQAKRKKKCEMGFTLESAGFRSSL